MVFGFSHVECVRRLKIYHPSAKLLDIACRASEGEIINILRTFTKKKKLKKERMSKKERIRLK